MRSTDTFLFPARYRGLTNSLSGLIGNIAFLLAACLGTPFLLGTVTHWKYIFWIEISPCLIHILLNILTFHDSPTYLLSIGKGGEAEESLKAYYGDTCHVKRVLEDLRVAQDSGTRNQKSLREILKDKAGAQALSLSMAINFSVAFR